MPWCAGGTEPTSETFSQELNQDFAGQITVGLLIGDKYRNVGVISVEPSGLLSRLKSKRKRGEREDARTHHANCSPVAHRQCHPPFKTSARPPVQQTAQLPQNARRMPNKPMKSLIDGKLKPPVGGCRWAALTTVSVRLEALLVLGLLTNRKDFHVLGMFLRFGGAYRTGAGANASGAAHGLQELEALCAAVTDSLGDPASIRPGLVGVTVVV